MGATTRLFRSVYLICALTAHAGERQTDRGFNWIVPPRLNAKPP
jgi:hypothetical protein